MQSFSIHIPIGNEFLWNQHCCLNISGKCAHSSVPVWFIYIVLLYVVFPAVKTSLKLKCTRIFIWKCRHYVHMFLRVYCNQSLHQMLSGPPGDVLYFGFMISSSHQIRKLTSPKIRTAEDGSAIAAIVDRMHGTVLLCMVRKQAPSISAISYPSTPSE